MSPSRMRWAIGGVGPKPGKAESLSLLLESSDLPGSGWRQTDERTWKTGSSGSDADWAARAREMKSITAWRSFEAKREQRWVWVQAALMASNNDAISAVQVAASMGVANLRRRGEVIQSGEAEQPAISGTSSVSAHESVVKADGVSMRSVIVAASVDATVFVVAFTAELDDSSWTDLAPVLAAQASRVSDASAS